jgi:hypothetical protein
LDLNSNPRLGKYSTNIWNSDPYNWVQDFLSNSEEYNKDIENDLKKGKEFLKKK